MCKYSRCSALYTQNPVYSTYKNNYRIQISRGSFKKEIFMKNTTDNYWPIHIPDELVLPAASACFALSAYLVTNISRSTVMILLYIVILYIKSFGLS
jgi:organic hydroperoxide reductase OsmC/OhrA